jgi:hypothetical protein
VLSGPSESLHDLKRKAMFVAPFRAVLMSVSVLLSVDVRSCVQPQEDLSRFLGPQPGQSHVYRSIGDPVFAEMVATGRTAGRPNSVLVDVTFRKPNRSLSPGQEATGYQYIIEAKAGALWKRDWHQRQISSGQQSETANDRPGVVFRGPLRAGVSGWSWWEEGRGIDGKDAFGPCHLVAVEASVILGAQRSAVTVTCGIKHADGTETVLTEQWAAGLGMVKHREEFISQKGVRGFISEDVLEAIEPAR